MNRPDEVRRQALRALVVVGAFAGTLLATGLLAWRVSNSTAPALAPGQAVLYRVTDNTGTYSALTAVNVSSPTGFHLLPAEGKLLRLEEVLVQGATISRSSNFYRQDADGLYLAGIADSSGGNAYRPAMPVWLAELEPGGAANTGQTVWQFNYGPWFTSHDLQFALRRTPNETITVPLGTVAGTQHVELAGEADIGQFTQQYWFLPDRKLPVAFDYRDEKSGNSLRYELLSATWHPPAADLLSFVPLVRRSGPSYLDRGGPERTGVTASGPVEWAAAPALHPYWQFTAPVDLTAPPLLTGDLLLLGDAEGQLWAVDPASGAVRWTFATGQPIVATPAVAGGITYVASGPRLYALEAEEGLFLWRVRADDVIDTSPLVLGDDVFFGAEDGFVYALDARRGTERWRFSAGSPVTGIAATRQGNRYVLCLGTTEGALFALSAATGEPLWDADLDGAVTGAPVLVNGAAYAGSSGQMGTGQVTAFDLTDGAVRWVAPIAGGVVGALAADPDSVYVGTSLGSLFALDRATGAERWRLRVGNGALNAPIVAGDRLIVADTLGGVRVVDAATGAVVTSRSEAAPFGAPPAFGAGRLFLADRYRNAYAYSLGAPPPGPALRISPAGDHFAADVNLGARVGAGPASWRGQPLVILDNGDLWLFDAHTGGATRLAELGGFPVAPPVVQGDIAYLGFVQRLDGDGAVVAFDLARQEIRWQHDADGAVVTPPSLDDGRLLAVASTEQGQRLLAFDAADGGLLWQDDVPASAFAPPLASGGNVYRAAGTVRAWAGATGEALWQTAELSAGSPMTVCQGLLIVGAVGKNSLAIMALDPTTGDVRWQNEQDVAFPRGQPACDEANRQVVVAGLNGQIQAFDLGTGSRNWTFRAGDPFLTDIQLADGVVYGVTDQTTLVALEARSGRLLARYAPPHAGWSRMGLQIEGNNIYLSDDLFLYALHVSHE